MTSDSINNLNVDANEDKSDAAENDTPEADRFTGNLLHTVTKSVFL